MWGTDAQSFENKLADTWETANARSQWFPDFVKGFREKHMHGDLDYDNKHLRGWSLD